VVFSVATTINAYYTAALTPAVAAIVGAGIAALWSEGRSGSRRRIGLAIIVGATVAYAAWLVPGSGPHVPAWLAPAVIVVGLGAVGAALGSIVRRSDTVFVVALAAGLFASSLAPAVASTEIVAHHEGAFDTPFEPAAEKAAIDALFVQTPAQVALTIPRLELARRGAPDLLATQTAAVASVFINASGLEALPIGGFTGTIPSPSLRQLKADVRQGRFHLVLAGTSTDPRLRWIAASCLHLVSPTPELHSYYCLPRDAG
jgi:4-amino-4-deoxy-L-arabinose transferase-like glycosyltransferase